jgi:hypothetical protein
MFGHIPEFRIWKNIEAKGGLTKTMMLPAWAENVCR